jgi:hypothetical protein
VAAGRRSGHRTFSPGSQGSARGRLSLFLFIFMYFNSSSVYVILLILFSPFNFFSSCQTSFRIYICTLLHSVHADA